MVRTETLKPINDFVLLEESLPEAYTTYKGYTHVIAPPAYEHGPEDRLVLGKVIAKGEDCLKGSIKPGVVALLGKWSGARFPRNEKSYLLVKESDILAVIE